MAINLSEEERASLDPFTIKLVEWADGLYLESPENLDALDMMKSVVAFFHAAKSKSSDAVKLLADLWNQPMCAAFWELIEIVEKHPEVVAEMNAKWDEFGKTKTPRKKASRKPAVAGDGYL